MWKKIANASASGTQVQGLLAKEGHVMALDDFLARAAKTKDEVPHQGSVATDAVGLDSDEEGLVGAAA
eukprot:2197054-Amphidinium_carterae.1